MHPISLFLSRLIFALTLLCVGTASVALAFSEEARDLFINFIYQQTLILFFFGLGFFLAGIALVIYLIFNTKKKYYHIASGPFSVTADENLIKEIVNLYWKEQFPKQDYSSYVFIKNNMIHLKVELPYVPFSQQKNMLERFKRDLQRLFADELGYQKSFQLSVNFQMKKLESEKLVTG